MKYPLEVKLVAHTPNPDELCGSVATICYDGKNWQSALRSCIENGHTAVLEHASFTFRIDYITRACLAQLTRHRLASFCVRSQRYCDESYGSAMFLCDTGNEALESKWSETVSQCFSMYKEALAEGIPKETARWILPEGTMTSLYVTMNARELLHFFSLRCCNRAQEEIRELADKMKALVSEVAPMIFEKSGAACQQGKACPEGKRTCGHPRQK